MSDHLDRRAGALDAQLTRRRMLQLTAATGVASFLVACGTAGRTGSPTGGATGTPSSTGTPGATGAPTSGPTGSPAGTSGPTGEPSADPTAEPTPAQVGGSFRWANWIGYIDVSDDGSTYPTLEAFTQATGVQAEYLEAVDDNETFFAAQLKEPLQQDVETGWDLVVLTDWMIARLIRRGWLEEIDTANTPNFPANLADQYVGRAFDPETKYAAPWQSGMTGITYDRAQTGELDSLEVFWDHAYEQRILYLSEMRDTVGLSALRLGVDPATLTDEQFAAAVAEIRRGVDEGIARELTGNYYVNVLARGNAVVAMGWSGDVLGLLVPDQTPEQDFAWALASEGGMLWTDNMAIPKGARNKRQAEAWIDYYYRPEVAAAVEAWVNYVCPVKGAREEILAIDPSLAENTLIFPTEEMVARLHQFRNLDGDTEQRWQEAFNDAVGL